MNPFTKSLSYESFEAIIYAKNKITSQTIKKAFERHAILNKKYNRVGEFKLHHFCTFLS
jgi:hypothetical protein